MNTSFQSLRDALSQDLASRLKADRRGVALGLFAASGRQLGVTIHETTHDGVLRISDAGEAWSDLWIDGVVDARPQGSMLDRLRSACERFGVGWDQSATAIAGTATTSTFADVAMRIAFASLTIDGWRHWLRAGRRERGPAAKAVVGELERVAPTRGWQVERDVVSRGALRNWRFDAQVRRADQQISITFIPGADARDASERAAGWVHDLDATPIVFVVAPAIADEVAADGNWTRRASFVARTKAGVAARILDAAERLAA